MFLKVLNQNAQKYFLSCFLIVNAFAHVKKYIRKDISQWKYFSFYLDW